MTLPDEGLKTEKLYLLHVMSNKLHNSAEARNKQIHKQTEKKIIYILWELQFQ